VFVRVRVCVYEREREEKRSVHFGSLFSINVTSKIKVKGRLSPNRPWKPIWL
jgi:hypothetical protein